MREDFDLPADIINLNSGTLSVSPRTVQQATHAFLDEYNQVPAMSLFETWERLWYAQCALARFVHADPRHLFFRSNVTLALQDLLFSLKIPKGEEILTCDWEYGAIVNILKWKAEREGLILRSFAFSSEDTTSAEGLVNAVKKALSSKTKLLMLSHVMTGNGLVLPIAKIGELCRSRGVHFIVDGAHGAGALNLDFRELQSLDAYASNLHKWTLGPKGTGFGWVHPDLRPLLRPAFAEWTSFETPTPFMKFQGDRFSQQWMMNSTGCFPPFFALPQTFEYWQKKGPETLRNRQSKLRDLLHEVVFEKTGWRCLSEFPKDLRGPMIAFELPEPLANQGYQLMHDFFTKRKLLVAMTKIDDRFAIRLAPHIYNTEDEIRRAGEILSQENP